jgi:hypothetical protein
MSSSDRTELVLLMSYAEIIDYLTNTPEAQIQKADQRLNSISRESTARELAGMKRIGNILQDLNEENLDEVMNRLDRHNENEQDWAFLELAEQSRTEDLEAEISELKEIKQTPWAKTRELNDRYNLFGHRALAAAKLCNEVSAVTEYRKTATKAGQLFVLTALAVEKSLRLPKEAPKHRDQIQATYEEAWALLQTLIDSGLDIVAYGYGILGRRVERSGAESKETDLPF